MVTTALTTTAPDWSATDPSIVPALPSDCPETGSTDENRTNRPIARADLMMSSIESVAALHEDLSHRRAIDAVSGLKIAVSGRSHTGRPAHVPHARHVDICLIY